MWKVSVSADGSKGVKQHLVSRRIVYHPVSVSADGSKGVKRQNPSSFSPGTNLVSVSADGSKGVKLGGGVGAQNRMGAFQYPQMDRRV